MFLKADFVVGNEFCLVSNNRGKKEPKVITVSKIGRKYISFDGSPLVYDLEKGFMIAKGYGHEGDLYKSEKDYRESLEVKDKLNQIKKIVDQSSVRNSKESFEEIRTILECFKSSN